MKLGAVFDFDQICLWCSLHTAKLVHVLVEHKADEDLGPAIIVRKVVVVLRGNFLDLRKKSAGNTRKIVVLVMVTDVVPNYVVFVFSGFAIF